MWKFRPILKDTIWGGTRIASFKGITPESVTIGESWELSGVPGSVSVVADGPEKGTSLNELLGKFGDAILGKRNYKKFGDRFPLLIKLIDASHNLSIQVHPDDDMARRYGQDNGKTEMWYVIDAHPEAIIVNGFKEAVEPDSFDRLVENGEIEKALNYVNVKAGDAFLIPGGRVHSIGAGVFIAEIQQTSDATYRIYDYNRTDGSGNKRKLHTTLAREAINFDDRNLEAATYSEIPDIPVNILRTPYFTTNVLNIGARVLRDYSELDSFVVLIVTSGDGKLRCGADLVSEVPMEVDVKRGDTILISASAKGLAIEPGESGLKMLETYMA